MTYFGASLRAPTTPPKSSPKGRTFTLKLPPLWGGLGWGASAIAMTDTFAKVLKYVMFDCSIVLLFYKFQVPSPKFFPWNFGLGTFFPWDFFVYPTVILTTSLQAPTNSSFIIYMALYFRVPAAVMGVVSV